MKVIVDDDNFLFEWKGRKFLVPQHSLAKFLNDFFSDIIRRGEEIPAGEFLELKIYGDMFNITYPIGSTQEPLSLDPEWDEGQDS